MGEGRINSGFDSIGGVCGHSLSELLIADFYPELVGLQKEVCRFRATQWTKGNGNFCPALEAGGGGGGQGFFCGMETILKQIFFHSGPQSQSVMASWQSFLINTHTNEQKTEQEP